MFPQHIDLEFFYCRKWSGRLKERPGASRQVPTIDDVIAVHAGTRCWPRNELAAWNLTMLLRSVRRRGGSVEQKLRDLATHPNTSVDPKKRAAFARKWLKRIT